MKTIVKIGLIGSLVVGACLSANVMADTSPIISFNPNSNSTTLPPAFNRSPLPKAPNASITAGWTRQQKELLAQYAQLASSIGWGAVMNTHQGPARVTPTPTDSQINVYEILNEALLERRVAQTFPKNSLKAVLGYLQSVRESAEAQASQIRDIGALPFDVATAAPDLRVYQASASARFRNRGNVYSDLSEEEEEEL